jgi:regulator of cell morphogenesis and NO signaling
MAQLDPSSVSPQQTLAEIVLADARAAAVFDRVGLDYCCRGHQTLDEAIAGSGASIDAVLTELAGLHATGAPIAIDAGTGDLDALTSDIVARHHTYVREISPIIEGWLAKMQARHGLRHPEINELQTVFAALHAELTEHMTKEETILFPFIDALAAAVRGRERAPAGPFGTIINPIRVMEHDHREAGELLARLRTLTNNYTPPQDACMTVRLCYDELARFEADLHRHIHLENNVLFPRAIELEQRLG